MSKCLARRIPTNPGVSVIRHGNERVSATKTGKSMEGTAAELPAGFWLSDLSYNDLRQIDDRQVNRVIHSDGWIGRPWSQIMANNGVSYSTRADEVSELAKMSERTIRLAVHSLTETKFWQQTNQRVSDRRTFGRPSLAFGLADYFRPLLANTTPTAIHLVEPSRSMLLLGASGKKNTSNDNVVVEVSTPKFSYLCRLANQTVPSGRVWQQIDLPEDNSPLTDGLLSNLQREGQHIAIEGYFHPYQFTMPTWVRSWLRGPDPSWGRHWFTLEEVNLLRRHGDFFVEGAFVCRPKHETRPEHSTLGQVVEGMIAACGGERQAHFSRSVGFAVENIIRALCGNFKSQRSPASMEAVWIAAYDRINSLPAIAAAEAAGGEFLESIAGTVRFSVRNKASAVKQVVDALWRLGFYLPVGIARVLHDHNLNLLADAAEFGGDKSDLPLAIASQHGIQNLVQRMDTVAGSGKVRQSKQLNQLVESLASFGHAIP